MKSFLSIIAIALCAMGLVTLFYSRGDDIRLIADNAVAFPITATTDYVGVVAGSFTCLLGLAAAVMARCIAGHSSIDHIKTKTKERLMPVPLEYNPWSSVMRRYNWTDDQVKQALDHIRVIVVMGQSGCGKSTFANNYRDFMVKEMAAHMDVFNINIFDDVHLNDQPVIDAVNASTRINQTIVVVQMPGDLPKVVVDNLGHMTTLIWCGNLSYNRDLEATLKGVFKLNSDNVFSQPRCLFEVSLA